MESKEWWKLLGGKNNKEMIAKIKRIDEEEWKREVKKRDENTIYELYGLQSRAPWM